MKNVLLAFAVSAAFVSCGAGATGKIDITNPFDHATRTELKAEATTRANADKALDGKISSEGTTRANADKNLQSQIDQKGYEINTQAKYTTSVNNDLQASKAAGAAAYNELKGTQGQQQGQINAVQNAAQIANEKADAGAVRADGIEARAAVTDNRSINNAVRLDGAEKNIGKNTSAIAGNTKTINQHTTQIATIHDVNAAQQTQINTSTTTNNRQDVTLGQHSNDISALQDYSRDMDSRLGGRLDSQQSQISQNKREIGTAKNMAVAGLAVANMQFCTGQECGFQIAGAVANMEGKNAIAFGAGGAVSENVFINGAFTTAGSVTGVSAGLTYRLK